MSPDEAPLSSRHDARPLHSFDAIWIVPVLLLGEFYISSAPVGIQGGDTPELVAAAYGLLVPHPPGFPLWIWLMHFWTNLLPLGSVFWRASALNALFSISCLFTVGWSLKRSPLVSALAVLSIGLTPAFVHSSVLPDVFALHGLMVALFGAVYFSSKRSSSPIALLPLVFALACTNHTSAILLGPPFCFAAHTGLSDSSTRASWARGCALGALAFCLCYLSLELAHPFSAFSWGEVKSGTSVIFHVLRMEYGPFQLRPKNDFHQIFIDRIRNILAVPYWTSLPITALAFGTIWKTGRGGLNPRLAWYSVSLALSMALLFLANMAPGGIGDEILERFHVMPLVIFTFLLGHIVQVEALDKKLLRAVGGLAVLCATVASVKQIQLQGLRSDFTFEDHSRNLLRMADRHLPAVIFPDSDSSYFGLRYLQSVENEGKSVIVMLPGLLDYPWYRHKLLQQDPRLKLPGDRSKGESGKLSIEQDIVRPNLDLFSFVSPRRWQNDKVFRITFMGLGERIETGAGTAFDEGSLQALQRRTEWPSGFPAGPQETSKWMSYSDYSEYFVHWYALHR